MTVRVGVDIGTTAVKAVVVDERGRTMHRARSAMSWDALGGRSEMAAERLLDTVRGALDAVLADVGGAAASIGIASFAESALLLDRDGAVLHPIVAWHDSRGSEGAAHLAESFGADWFAATTGLPPTSLCTAAKLRAFRDEGLELSDVAMVLPVADWIAYELTGTAAVDIGLASRTGLLDLHGRRWHDELVAWSGLNASALPALVDSGTVRGTWRSAVVYVAGMDHMVAAIGANAVEPGRTWDSCGTAEAFLTTTEPLESEVVALAVRRGLTVGWHAVPGRQVMVGAQRSGFAYSRLLTFMGVDGASALAALEAGTEVPGTDTVEFAGDLDEALTVSGITARTDRLAAWRVFVERTVDRGALLLGEISELASTDAGIVVGGGWSRSRVVREAKTARHRDVAFCDREEPGAEGAALWHELLGMPEPTPR